MMKIIVCPDSFKGSVTSLEAAVSIRKGLALASPESEVVVLPVADGGEGTLDAIVPEENRIVCKVRFPMVNSERSIDAIYGTLGDCAVIEMSRAAGLTLIREEERNPLYASTYGVGELIKDALDRGYRRILLTVGGSGTNDGGTGLLEALGAVFYNREGVVVYGSGGALSEMDRIDLSSLDKRLSECEFTIACDVTNPLTGPRGATMVYGGQKGADDQMLDTLERGMKNYVRILRRDFGADVDKIPGCGAGGGIAASLLAYANAKIVSGISAVLDILKFDTLLADADFVITGEGKTDIQSLFGKAVSGIASAAKGRGVPVFVFCGTIGEGTEGIYDIGVKGIFSIAEGPCTLDYAMENAPRLLSRLAYRWGKMYL
ncbi:MAG: glycerate kinase [Clostridiales bacterium]|nr:glycerate kinase [Clostridiales bacterium]